MKKNLLIPILCLLMTMVAFTGCGKKDAPNAATENTVAQVNAQNSADDNVNTDEDKFKTAILNVTANFKDLNDIVFNAGDDCEKLGTRLNAYLDQNGKSMVAHLKLAGSMDDDSPEADQYREEIEAFERISEEFFNQDMMEKCKDVAEVDAFAKSFITLLQTSAADGIDSESSDSVE